MTLKEEFERINNYKVGADLITIECTDGTDNYDLDTQKLFNWIEKKLDEVRMNIDELSLLEEWYNVIEDTNPKYSNNGDKILYEKILSQIEKEIFRTKGNKPNDKGRN